MAGATKLMTSGGGGVILTPATNIAADVTVSVPSSTGTLAMADAYGNLNVTGALVYNSQTINASFTTPDNINAQSAGPITIANGITVTLGTNSYWVINGA